MGRVEWGVDPEFFGPRHAYREDRIIRALAAVSEPGLHLECAAGVGSLSLRLADLGHTVVAADASLKSLAVVAERADEAGDSDRIKTVVADITRLPFADSTFSSATSAETLEHIEAHEQAVSEMARILEPGGRLVGTTPAGPRQWSEWDDWAGHVRRYTKTGMEALLDGAGFEHEVTLWGWPVLRLYDALVLTRINRRRLRTNGTIEDDPPMMRFAELGRKRWLVAAVQSAFSVDRVFDGCRWGVGILFIARSPNPVEDERPLETAPERPDQS